MNEGVPGQDGPVGPCGQAGGGALPIGHVRVLRTGDLDEALDRIHALDLQAQVMEVCGPVPRPAPQIDNPSLYPSRPSGDELAVLLRRRLHVA